MNDRSEILEKTMRLEKEYAEARRRAEETMFPFHVNEARLLKRKLEAMRNWT